MSGDDEVEQEVTLREAALTGLQPYQVRANRAVPDRLVRSLVDDFRRGPAVPSSLATRPGHSQPEPERPKGNGWVEAAPLKAPDVRWVDRQLDAQDKLDRAEALRRQLKNTWVEQVLGDDDE
jgi:hypothetical protein